VTATHDRMIGSLDGVSDDAAAQIDAYLDLLDADSREVPEVYRGVALTVPAERYTSKAFHDLEMEKVWKKVWQAACRVEDILEPGCVREVRHRRGLGAGRPPA